MTSNPPLALIATHHRAPARGSGLWAGVFALLMVTSPNAQAQQLPTRPSLPRGADRNDWEAYYDAGAALLQRDPAAADDAFVWASRLRPDLGEPLYARWISFWARDIDLFEKYVRDDEKVLKEPVVVQIDSLKRAAVRRTPFLHQGMVVFLYDQLPGRFRDDELTRGWIALGNAKLGMARDRFASVIAREPQKYGYLRFVRAAAFVNDRQYDSAQAELGQLLGQLRAEDERAVGAGYESKELLEYAVGLLHQQGGRQAAAKQAFGRALTENPGFAPAHAVLGRMALAQHDTAVALLEYGTAVEIEPGDVTFLLGYGKALLAAGRAKEGVVLFEKVVASEPYFAEGYFQLAAALEGMGDGAGAGRRYAEFLERAPLSDVRRSVAGAFRSPGGR